MTKIAGGRVYMMQSREEMAARLRARHAARLAAGDPRAIRIQAARDRAEIEQREQDQRERAKLIQDLKAVGVQIRPKIETRSPIAPRALNADGAAAYLGMGVTKFRELVKEDKLPRPVDLDGMPRWDRVELDAAFETMKEQTADPHKAGRARIQARIDEQKNAGRPSAEIVPLDRERTGR